MRELAACPNVAVKISGRRPPGQTGHAGHPYARDTSLSHRLGSALFCCGEDPRLGARERHAAPSWNLTTLWLCSPQGCSMNLAHCCISCRRKRQSIAATVVAFDAGHHVTKRGLGDFALYTVIAAPVPEG